MSRNYLASIQFDTNGNPVISTGSANVAVDTLIGTKETIAGKFSSKVPYVKGGACLTINGIPNLGTKFTIGFWCKVTGKDVRPWNQLFGQFTKHTPKPDAQLIIWENSGNLTAEFDNSIGSWPASAEGKLSFAYYYDRGQLVPTNKTTIDGNWHYIAYVRNDTSIYLFVDGIQVGYSNNVPLNVPIGSASGGQYCLGGERNSTDENSTRYLDVAYDDICFINDEAVWTSNFTPPTKILKEELDPTPPIVIPPNIDDPDVPQEGDIDYNTPVGDAKYVRLYAGASKELNYCGITGKTYRALLPLTMIKGALLQGVIVDAYKTDNTLIRLTLENFDKDNGELPPDPNDIVIEDKWFKDKSKQARERRARLAAIQQQYYDKYNKK